MIYTYFLEFQERDGLGIISFEISMDTYGKISKRLKINKPFLQAFRDDLFMTVYIIPLKVIELVRDKTKILVVSCEMVEHTGEVLNIWDVVKCTTESEVMRHGVYNCAG